MDSSFEINTDFNLYAFASLELTAALIVKLVKKGILSHDEDKDLIDEALSITERDLSKPLPMDVHRKLSYILNRQKSYIDNID